MKKQLPTHAITDELAGASAFFQSPEPAAQSPTVEPVETPLKQPKKQAGKKPAPLDSTDTPMDESLIPRYHDTTVSAFVERVRKAVKKVGKEAAVHRFTPEEKRELAEIIYKYARRGQKTSENEIARIGINWLVLDYKEQGEASILAQILAALNS
jgi:hypothetical protein